MATVAVMWFRRDLRLADNAALATALNGADSVSCVCSMKASGSGRSAGPASRAWRSLSLAALDSELRVRGGGLLALRGPVPDRLVAQVRRHRAGTVFCTRDWTPAGMAEEHSVREALQSSGAQLAAIEGSLLVAPDSLRTASGSPYRVFTPYYRAWEHEWHASVPPLVAPDRIPAPDDVPTFSPPPNLPGAPNVGEHWSPGELAAATRLKEFVEEALHSYDQIRDIPAADGTSRLSAALACGELTTRQIATVLLRDDRPSDSKRVVLRQLGWRAFSYHVLHHVPTLAEEPWREEFSAMPWRDDPDGFDAWKAGMTGYPLVDAGMRQLLETGWTHNRSRLVAASFLTKDLLIPWQKGEQWFWERLIDADPAINAFSWQWISGSGADAAPYFRIFNPTRQGQRFDPDGAYVRRWVPELADVPTRWIHRPWEAPAAELTKAGVTLGETYPRPIVDHEEARHRALAAYEHVRSKRAEGE